VGTHVGVLAIEKVSGSSYAADTSANQFLATQLAFGPGPDPNKNYLYVASDTRPVRRFEVDSVTGALTNRVDVLPLAGLGIAFRSDSLDRSELTCRGPTLSENAANAGPSRLIRFADVDGDGVFNGVSDGNASIAHGISADGHALNQIQIAAVVVY
jgi:hypothetical protein